MPFNVRYIVDDTDTAIAFYSEQLGFESGDEPGPGLRGPLPR